MNLLAIIWDVSPVLIEFNGILIRWYSIFFALPFLCGYFIVKLYTKKANISEKAYDFWLLYMIIGAIVGARIGHVLFYELDYYLQHPAEIFMTWKGGMSSHGGAIGLLVALWVLSKQFKISFIFILDKISAAIALGGGFLRLGNLMNSEIYGYPTDLPWGFIYQRSDLDLVPRHPTQLYEALSYFMLFAIIHFLDRKNDYKSPKGQLFAILLMGVFGSRFLIEFVKESQVYFENSMVLNMGQWLSIPFIILGATFFIISNYTQSKKLK